jgi:hypothetical protein
MFKGLFFCWAYICGKRVCELRSKVCGTLGALVKFPKNIISQQS